MHSSALHAESLKSHELDRKGSVSKQPLFGYQLVYKAKPITAVSYHGNQGALKPLDRRASCSVQ